MKTSGNCRAAAPAGAVGGIRYFRHPLFIVGLLLAAGGAFTAGCSDSSGQEPTPVAGPADASCFDVVSSGGAVHLLFGVPSESEGEPISFYYARSAYGGQTWSTPHALPTDHATPGRHERGNDPQLAVRGDRLLAVWTAEGDGPWGSGPLASAVSSDGGETWQPGPTPAVGSAGVGFRFPAVAADDEGFHAIWIHAEGDERSLRHAALAFEADAWTEPTVVDPHMCACCWNQLKVADDGSLYALYRDQDPSDMSMAISFDGGTTWDLAGNVGGLGWMFEGCPHVGGGLALRSVEGRTEAIASVWSGHEERGGSYVLRSEDVGGNWQPDPPEPDRMLGGRNTDVVWLEDGRAAVVWDEPTGDGASVIYLSLSEDAGASWGEPRPVSAVDEIATHPRIVSLADEVVVFWTNRSDGASPFQTRRISTNHLAD